MSAWLPKQGVHSALSGPCGGGLGARWGRGRDSPGQHDGGAVGEVAGPGAITEALQCEAKADEARADGEAELEQEAEQEVVLGLREEGGLSLQGPRPLQHLTLGFNRLFSARAARLGEQNRDCPPRQGSFPALSHHLLLVGDTVIEGPS